MFPTLRARLPQSQTPSLQFAELFLRTVVIGRNAVRDKLSLATGLAADKP